MIHFVALLSLGLIVNTSAYSAGAPSMGTVCTTDMTPIHGLAPRTSPCPFVVDTSQDTYFPNETIEVVLHGPPGEQFKGFILQFRRADLDMDQSEKHGTFTPVPLTKGTCASYGGLGASLTHNSRDLKTEIRVNWTAPIEGVGDLEIWYTLLYNYSHYWVMQKSDVIYDISNITVTAGSTLTTPSGTQTPIEDIDVEGCGRIKGCYRDPPQCPTADCYHIITWRADDHMVHFEMSSKIEASSRWLSLGFSKDGKMGDDPVVDCIYDESVGFARIRLSWNGDNRVNDPLTNSALGLNMSTTRAYYTDGYLICKFSHYKMPRQGAGLTTANEMDKVANLYKKYYLMVGHGPAMEGFKTKHHRTPYICPQLVNVTAAEFTDIGGHLQYPLVKAHACMMIIAWMLLASVGVLMSRHFKPAFPNLKIAKKPIWFQVHQACMVLVFLLTVAGFVVIFVFVGGYSSETILPEKAHPPLGIIVTILAVANPFMSLFRCDPGTPRRPLFNWAHFLVGQAAHILAAATIFIGVYMGKANMPPETGWLVLTFILWHILTEIILYAHTHTLKRRAKRSAGASAVGKSVFTVDGLELHGNSYKLEKNGLHTPPDEEKKKPSDGSCFKGTVIIIYLVGNLVITIALCVWVAIG